MKEGLHLAGKIAAGLSLLASAFSIAVVHNIPKARDADEKTPTTEQINGFYHTTPPSRPAPPKTEENSVFYSVKDGVTKKLPLEEQQKQCSASPQMKDSCIKRGFTPAP